MHFRGLEIWEIFCRKVPNAKHIDCQRQQIRQAHDFIKNAHEHVGMGRCRSNGRLRVYISGTRWAKDVESCKCLVGVFSVLEQIIKMGTVKT